MRSSYTANAFQKRKHELCFFFIIRAAIACYSGGNGGECKVFIIVEISLTCTAVNKQQCLFIVILKHIKLWKINPNLLILRMRLIGEFEGSKMLN